MDLNELFGRIGQPQETPPQPPPEAQLAELLLIRKAIMAEQQMFQPGQQVRWKRGCGTFRADMRERIPMLWWRGLDLGKLEDQLRLKIHQDWHDTLPNPDCLVACMGNGDITFHLAQGSLLEAAGAGTEGAGK